MPVSMHHRLSQLQAEQLPPGTAGGVGDDSGRNTGWWRGRAEPIIMLIEESSGVDELMRHVDTG